MTVFIVTINNLPKIFKSYEQAHAYAKSRIKEFKTNMTTWDNKYSHLSAVFSSQNKIEEDPNSETISVLDETSQTLLKVTTTKVKIDFD